MQTFESMFDYTWRAICHEDCKYNLRAQVDSCSSTQLCTRAKEHLLHASLHKSYPRVYFEQEVLRVLAELNSVEIARIVCACITTRDFYSSSNRAVLYFKVILYMLM